MGERLTAAELAEIEARLRAATPGPWEMADEGPNRGVLISARRQFICRAYGGDAALIAHAPMDLSRLLDEVHALKAERDVARAAATACAAMDADHLSALHAEIERMRSVVAAALRWANLWPFAPGPEDMQEPQENALRAAEQELFAAVRDYFSQSGEK